MVRIPMSERLLKARDIARDIKQDCASDAAALDRTPFTPRGMGETFGTVLAICSGLAGVVIALADEIEALQTEAANSHSESA